MANSPEPVLVQGGAAVIASVLAPLLAKWGIDADGTSQVLAYVLTVVSSVVAIAQLFAVRRKVTPTAAPRNNHGVPLTPAGQ